MVASDLKTVRRIHRFQAFPVSRKSVNRKSRDSRLSSINMITIFFNSLIGNNILLKRLHNLHIHLIDNFSESFIYRIFN